jgi:tetratricopeptide (TPR) repeat protein
MGLFSIFLAGATAAFELKRDDEAINDCTQAIRLDPKRGFACGYRAVAFKAKGDIDRAMTDFAEARRLKLEGQ